MDIVDIPINLNRELLRLINMYGVHVVYSSLNTVIEEMSMAYYGRHAYENLKHGPGEEMWVG